MHAGAKEARLGARWDRKVVFGDLGARRDRSGISGNQRESSQISANQRKPTQTKTNQLAIWRVGWPRRKPAETSGNQRKSAGINRVKAETLHNAKGRIYKNLQRSKSDQTTTCRAAPPNSKCKMVCSSRCGEAMRWEYPVCSEIEFASLVVLRPYVSLIPWSSS